MSSYSSLFSALIFFLSASAASAESPYPPPLSEEELLVEALELIRERRLDAALETIDSLLEVSPKFRLARMIKGDLLLAKAGPIERMGNLPSTKEKLAAGLREEARSRLKRYGSPMPQGGVPANLLRLAPSQEQALVIDLERSRLYLYENGDEGLRLVRDFYAAGGQNGAVKHREGDLRTPVGVYFVTHRIERELPDLYGAGAFAIDYPNPWDRRLGRTGYGIWLHGVPSDTYSRAPRSSEGCLTVANSDFEALTPYLEDGGTPVIIAERLEWLGPRRLELRRNALETALERWRQDWESLDVARYAGNYSRDFQAGRADYEAWVAHKEGLAHRKSYIRVALADLSILTDPTDPGLAVVRFAQEYASSNYSDATNKRQYWRLEEDGVWRIVYEGEG